MSDASSPAKKGIGHHAGAWRLPRRETSLLTFARQRAQTEKGSLGAERETAMKMKWLLSSNAPAATVLIRILVGAVFLSEGILKFLLPDELGVGRFARIGIPAPEVMGPSRSPPARWCCSACSLVRRRSRFSSISLWPSSRPRFPSCSVTDSGFSRCPSCRVTASGAWPTRPALTSACGSVAFF